MLIRRRHRPLEEQVQQLGDRGALLGQGLGQGATGELEAAAGVRDRLPGERFDVGHDPVERRVHQGAHLGGGELQVVGFRAFHGAEA